MEESSMANAFVHVELNTTDVDKAKAFYGKLFEWSLEDIPMGERTYTMINVGKGTGGGMMKQLIPGASSAWLPYVEVADILAATKKARGSGCDCHEGCHRSHGHGLAQHYRRSYRGYARPVEDQISGQVTGRLRPKEPRWWWSWRDAGATETKRAANISPPLFIHTGELLFGVSLALVITHVAQVPTSFPTIATKIFTVVVEAAFIVVNLSPIRAHFPTIVTQVAAIGAKIAVILFQILAVGTDVGSLFGGGSGITVSNVLPQFPSILLYVGLIRADVAAVAISLATVLA
jgi:predicted enzyme related to lactoylglutathione lyase